MQKKQFVIILLFVCCSFVVFGQAKPRMGILPFTGGTGKDSENITTLISFQSDILRAFTLVPSTNAVQALVLEPKFQFSGCTDSDTIAQIGRLLDADFVVSGYLRQISGDRKLIVYNVVNTSAYELLGGGSVEYGNAEDIPGLLAEIGRNIVTATKRDTSRLPKLAVRPVRLTSQEGSMAEAEMLSQILIIELTNSGKYAVLPRLTNMRVAMIDIDNRMGGYSAAEKTMAIGRAMNADNILNSELRKQDVTNTFSAFIIDSENGNVSFEIQQSYRIIDEGVRLMPSTLESATVTQLSTRPVAPPPPGAPPPPQQTPPTTPPPVPPSQQAPSPQQTPPPDGAVPMAQEPVPSAEPEVDEFPVIADNSAKLWTIGVSAGSSFGLPLLVGTVHGTIAPFKYMFIEIGCDGGGLKAQIEDLAMVEDDYWSLTPFGHLAFFLPFNKGGWYIGAGGGYMIENINVQEPAEAYEPMALYPILSFTTGINLLDMIDISYTFRLGTYDGFRMMSQKLSLGYVYRFK
jgi:hypothetical protein